MHSHVTLPHWCRTAVATGVFGALLFSNGCTQKEAAFFASFGSLPELGSITAIVDGTPAGASVRLTGLGRDESHIADGIGYTFDGLALGSYQLVVTPPSGYSCSPMSSSVDISSLLPNRTVIFTCSMEPTFGSISFTTSGLSGSTSYLLTLTGAANLSGQLGVSGLEFDNLAAGTYGWSYDLGASPMYTCDRLSGSINLTAGASFTQAISCAPAVGTLSVSVLGATATVGFTGPATGGGSVGATPVLFPNLPIGAYTVAITDPSGFTCLPVSTPADITAGNTTAVQFECTVIAATMDYMLGLSGLYTPGVVTGSTTGTLFSGGSAAGTYLVEPGGPGNNYYGTSPDRVGFDAGNWFTFRNFSVGGSNYSVTRVEFCATTSFSGLQFLDVTYVDDSQTSLGTATLTSGPGCFSETTPSGTTGFRVRGNGSGSFDINNLTIVGVSW